MKKLKLSWKFLLIYTLFVIVWGAFVRASGSGDGCGTHWPTCHGQFFLESPSFKTLVEYFHRATSGLYGIFVFLLALWTFFSKQVSKTAKLFALSVLAFTILESLIGAKLVLAGLVGKNTSIARAQIMVVHFVNTLILVGSNVGVIFFLEKDLLAWKPLKKMKTTLMLWGPLVILFFLTGMSGALAALGDTLYPSESLIKGFAMDFDANSPWLVKVRSFHPFFAFILVGSILMLSKTKEVFGGWLSLLALTTLVVGLINLVFLAPWPLQLIHLLIAQSFWIVFCFYFFNEVSEKINDKAIENTIEKKA